jgi:helix-turn-helix protein
MSIDFDLDQPETTEVADAPEQVVEVRRRAGLAVALGAGASLVAVAYLARAANGGGVLDWVLFVVLGLIGVANLAALLDARTPLLVADELGVRLRLSRTWVGLPWGGLAQVEHRPRRGWRDGLLIVHTHYVQRILEDLDPPARRTARLNCRLHRTPLVVPLGLGTRVVGATPDLVAALRALSDGRTPVVATEADDEVPIEVAEISGETGVIADLPVSDLPDDLAADEPRDDQSPWSRVPDPRPAIAGLIGRVAAAFDRPERDHDDEHDQIETDEEPVEIEASATPEPVRPTVAAARAEIRHESRAEVTHPDAGEDDVEQTPAWAALDAVPEVSGGLLIDDLVSEPAPDPVLGPQFAAARRRLGLTVDELADRTRIRPHVIEAIEVDDFGACGGDFYARGHLRTLARVLGVDVAPILTTYDERYADAPIDPRRVFEAELAGAGSIRATRGGPNWSVLVAAVMALVLCWSVARLVTGGPDQTPDRAVLSGSGGPNHSSGPVAKPVAVALTASGGGARVVVRDGTGKLVFSGDLAFGQRHTVQASPPVRVQSTDGSVRVTVGGQDRGRMGPAGRPATQSYVVRR